MPHVPPASLRNLIHEVLFILLRDNPIATSSESFVQHHVEFAVLEAHAAQLTNRVTLSPVGSSSPRPYYLRIGINYHADKVQHIQLDAVSGHLIGWNPVGNALGSGSKAKMLLSGVTIFERDSNEQLMTDTKIGGGDMQPGQYIRVEFKVRGWLGKTKNLDGKQLEKDLDLLKQDKADLLVICLSEVAHLKWCGAGPGHQASRRTGTSRFGQLLLPPSQLSGSQVITRPIQFEGQNWQTSCQKVIASNQSIMPGAEHFVTLCWRT